MDEMHMFNHVLLQKRWCENERSSNSVNKRSVKVCIIKHYVKFRIFRIIL